MKPMTYDRRIATIHLAALAMGETFENESWRVHRFRPSLRVTSLIGAGKRGTRCEEMSLYSDYGDMTDEVAEAVLKAVKAKVSPSQMSALMKDLAEASERPNKFNFYLNVLKGVEVKPGGFEKVKVVGDHVHIEADYDSFSVEDLKDQNNLPTCIARGKKSIYQFYRFVKDNRDKLKHMTFGQVTNAMSDAGIDFHQYCAMD